MFAIAIMHSIMKKQKTTDFESHGLDETCQELLTLAEEIQQEVNKLNQTLFSMLEKKKKLTESLKTPLEKSQAEPTIPKEKEELSEVTQHKAQDHISTLFNQDFVVKSRGEHHQQENSESSDVFGGFGNEDISNGVPKCCRCNAMYSSACIRYEHSAWKCAFCDNMNSAPNGFIFTYFKNQFPLFPELREEIISVPSTHQRENEVMIDLTKDEPVISPISPMPTVQYENRFTYVEDYVMMNGLVCVWVVPHLTHGKTRHRRGHYRPSIRKIHWHINGSKHASSVESLEASVESFESIEASVESSQVESIESSVEEMDESDEVVLYDSFESN